MEKSDHLEIKWNSREISRERERGITCWTTDLPFHRHQLQVTWAEQHTVLLLQSRRSTKGKLMALNSIRDHSNWNIDEEINSIKKRWGWDQLGRKVIFSWFTALVACYLEMPGRGRHSFSFGWGDHLREIAWIQINEWKAKYLTNLGRNKFEFKE